MTQLYTTEHRTVTYVSGPLLVADHAERVAYDELVDVVTPTGELRRGQVLEIAGDRMVVQVLGGTRGLDVTSTTVRAPGPLRAAGGRTRPRGQGSRRHGTAHRRRNPRCACGAA